MYTTNKHNVKDRNVHKTKIFLNKFVNKITIHTQQKGKGEGSL